METITLRSSRIYDQGALKTAIESYYKNMVVPGRAVGSSIVNYSNCVQLEHVSHLVERIEQVGSDVVCDIRILDTPGGKILKQLLEDKSVDFSIRGMGAVKDGVVVIDEIVTIDAIPKL